MNAARGHGENDACTVASIYFYGLASPVKENPFPLYIYLE